MLGDGFHEEACVEEAEGREEKFWNRQAEVKNCRNQARRVGHVCELDHINDQSNTQTSPLEPHDAGARGSVGELGPVCQKPTG